MKTIPGRLSILRVYPLVVSLFLAMLLPAPTLHSQTGGYSLGGRVVDQQTQEALAFVNIVVNETRQGGMTDIDGFFHITHSEPIERLTLSYVGYYPTYFEVGEESIQPVIEMKRQTIYLAAVDVFPGKNPAHRIIERAIANRHIHDPERKESFSYHSYNKFIFTGEFIENGAPPLPASADTLAARVERHLADNHFLIMETMNEHRYRRPNLRNETVLASRISGLENPIFAMMASQFQSFSFYGNYITISEEQYLSPLSPGSTSRYFFLLEDTTFNARDTVFVISYRPSRGKNFEGLQGVLYINSNGWAIQNVIAEPFPPRADTHIRIQQKYELVDGQHWFPSQLHTDVEFFGIKSPANFKVLGIGRTYLSNIQVDPGLSRRDIPAFDIAFSPQSIVRDEAFWNQHRQDALSQRERNTYTKMDSLGKARNLDGSIDRLEALFSGFWRKGPVDLDIREFISHNKVEGFRPGLGLRTNRHLSGVFSLHGHLAYGFKDEVLKYGGGGQVLLHRLSDLRLGVHYQYDRIEKGRTILLETHGLLDPQSIRAFFLTNLDMVEQQQAWLGWRMLRNNLNLRLFGQREVREMDENYIFNPNADNAIGFTRTFHTLETGLMLRLAPGHMHIMTPERTLSFGSYYPQYFLTLTKGWDNIADGDHNYLKAEAKIVLSSEIRMLGTQRWIFQGGIVQGDAPWHKLFNAPAAYRRFSVSVPQSFSTMRMDEFFSNQYAALFFSHNFKSLLFRRPGFSPKLLLLTNVGIGNLHNPENHLNVPLQSFPKGYFESGIAVLELMGSGVTSLGLEFMYRYGPYGFPQFSDNYSLRLSYSFILN